MSAGGADVFIAAILHTNYMKIKITPADICTVLQDVIKNHLAPCWVIIFKFRLRYLMSSWISTDDNFIS